ncbi:chromate transporter [Clostridia bacterium]|nr:chromate transporter [Clostridia bacterium]
MILLTLFIAFFKIGLFSFGGGLAMLPLIQNEVVLKMHWITHGEFLDAIAIAQVTPGPIALNVATYSGFKVHGISGSLFATLGVTMPSFLICLTLAMVFQKVRGHNAYENVLEIIKLVAIALIASTAIILTPTSIVDLKGFLIFIVTLIIFASERFNPALIIICSGIVGLLLY